MIRLSPPNFPRLEQTHSLDVQVASAAETTRAALAAARAAKVTTSLDLNYRAKLWTPAEAGRCMSDLMQFCDFLITSEEDIEKVFGIKSQDYVEAAGQVAKRFPV